ncbi:MAG: hypothetical protein QM723_29735 [Myxococcaceae bacterium]
MTALALSLLLVAVPVELTPPPLVELPSAAPDAPPEAARVPAGQPELSADGAQGYGNVGARMFATALTAAASSAITFGVTVWLSNQISGSSGAAPALTILAVPMTLMAAGASATGVHRKLDGQGSLWSHVGGLAIGAVLGLGIWAFTTGFRFSTDTPTTIGIGTAAALLAGLGAALMGELSHWRAWNENHPQVALMPIKGGASASLGWSF